VWQHARCDIKDLYRALSELSSVPNISYSTYRGWGVNFHVFFEIVYKIIKENNLHDE